MHNFFLFLHSHIIDLRRSLLLVITQFKMMGILLTGVFMARSKKKCTNTYWKEISQIS